MKYDLLIRDGEVIDPGSGLRGRMDVGIAGGKIAEVAPALREAEARRTISAKDRLVTPGLVDAHAHIFVNCADMGENTDRLCNSSGVTTVCDAGSAGSANFAGLRFVIDKAVRTRAREFVNLSAIGIVGTARSGELAHFPMPIPRAAPARSPRTTIWRSASSSDTAPASSGNTRRSRSRRRAAPPIWPVCR
jgi:dihydroorotase